MQVRYPLELRACINRDQACNNLVLMGRLGTRRGMVPSGVTQQEWVHTAPHPDPLKEASSVTSASVGTRVRQQAPRLSTAFKFGVGGRGLGGLH